MTKCPSRSRAFRRPSNTAARQRRESFAEGRARRAEIGEPAVILEAALRFLEVRHRSIDEVRRRLATAGYREDLISAAIDRLVELGMLDDLAFAGQWVESRDRAHPRGERILRLELAQHGVDRTIVDEVIADRNDAFATSQNHLLDIPPNAVQSTEDDAAWRLLARRGRPIARQMDARVRRQRAFALLARNGFDSSIATAVAAAWSVRFEGIANDDPLPDD